MRRKRKHSDHHPIGEIIEIKDVDEVKKVSIWKKTEMSELTQRFHDNIKGTVNITLNDKNQLNNWWYQVDMFLNNLGF